MTATAVAVLSAVVWRRRGGSRPMLVAAAGWGVLSVAGLALPILAVTLAAVRWRRAAAVSRTARGADDDVLLLADLVALGLAAGLPMRGALSAARPHLDPGLGFEVEGLLEEMDRRGTAGALIAARGRLEELGRVAAAAVASGAPLVAAVGAHADRLRHTRHESAVAAARRLPVRLLLPLALLILPGFVILAVGPALLQALARLAIP